MQREGKAPCNLSLGKGKQCHVDMSPSLPLALDPLESATYLWTRDTPHMELDRAGGKDCASVKDSHINSSAHVSKCE